ncbi:MAG TPA: glycosyltransferase [Acidimicrobiia bacterium]|jgi:glycosyltransferase involved in cell wall biosynthesis|nr:glycosyltransferase [Acidimicrobiia bacterium]
MKFLFVINSFGAGGAERSLVELLPRFREQGIAPIIVCLDHSAVGFEHEVEAGGFDVRFVDAPGRVGKLRSLRKLIKEEQPSLVYTSLFDADITGRLASIGTGVPVMSLLANTAYDPVRLDDPGVKASKLRIVRAVDGFSARHLTDHFHAVSQAVKDSTVETLGVAPENITVVYRGRDEARLGVPSPERRARVRDDLGIGDDVPMVITVGRQEYQKGHVHLVRAFASVVEACPTAMLFIAGRSGHAAARIVASIQEYELAESVVRLGHRSDVPDLLAAADLFVFPSVYEGLGGALIEALALGLPAVVSDLPALREVVVDGENAIVVPPADPGALASAIVTLLRDPLMRRQFGEKSRGLFEASFLADDAAHRLFELLVDVATDGTEVSR